MEELKKDCREVGGTTTQQAGSRLLHLSSRSGYLGKKADVLMAKIPPLEEVEWQHFIHECYSDLEFDRFKPLYTESSSLSDLQGIILFSSENEYQMILKKGSFFPIG